jgi:hypothetical protein
MIETALVVAFSAQELRRLSPICWLTAPSSLDWHWSSARRRRQAEINRAHYRKRRAKLPFMKWQP